MFVPIFFSNWGRHNSFLSFSSFLETSHSKEGRSLTTGYHAVTSEVTLIKYLIKWVPSDHVPYLNTCFCNNAKLRKCTSHIYVAVVRGTAFIYRRKCSSFTQQNSLEQPLIKIMFLPPKKKKKSRWKVFFCFCFAFKVVSIVISSGQFFQGLETAEKNVPLGRVSSNSKIE